MEPFLFRTAAFFAVLSFAGVFAGCPAPVPSGAPASGTRKTGSVVATPPPSVDIKSAESEQSAAQKAVQDSARPKK